MKKIRVSMLLVLTIFVAGVLACLAFAFPENRFCLEDEIVVSAADEPTINVPSPHALYTVTYSDGLYHVQKQVLISFPGEDPTGSYNSITSVIEAISDDGSRVVKHINFDSSDSVLVEGGIKLSKTTDTYIISGNISVSMSLKYALTVDSNCSAYLVDAVVQGVQSSGNLYVSGGQITAGITGETNNLNIDGGVTVLSDVTLTNSLQAYIVNVSGGELNILEGVSIISNSETTAVNNSRNSTIRMFGGEIASFGTGVSNGGEAYGEIYHTLFELYGGIIKSNAVVNYWNSGLVSNSYNGSTGGSSIFRMFGGEVQGNQNSAFANYSRSFADISLEILGGKASSNTYVIFQESTSSQGGVLIDEIDTENPTVIMSNTGSPNIYFYSGSVAGVVSFEINGGWLKGASNYAFESYNYIGDILLNGNAKIDGQINLSTSSKIIAGPNFEGDSMAYGIELANVSDSEILNRLIVQDGEGFESKFRITNGYQSSANRYRFALLAKADGSLYATRAINLFSAHTGAALRAYGVLPVSFDDSLRFPDLPVVDNENFIFHGWSTLNNNYDREVQAGSNLPSTGINGYYSLYALLEITAPTLTPISADEVAKVFDDVPVLFEVVASHGLSGVDYSYAWFKQNANSNEWNIIEGVNSSSIELSDALDSGKYKVVVTASRGALPGDSAEMVFTLGISPKTLTADDIVIDSITAKRATGRAITPNPVVMVNGVVLTLEKDYQLSYEDNVKKGTGIVYVQFIGNYYFEEDIVLTFEIQPGLDWLWALGIVMFIGLFAATFILYLKLSKKSKEKSKAKKAAKKEEKKRKEMAYIQVLEVTGEESNVKVDENKAIPVIATDHQVSVIRTSSGTDATLGAGVSRMEDVKPDKQQQEPKYKRKVDDIWDE